MNRQHSYLINGPQECKQPFYEGTMLPEQELHNPHCEEKHEAELLCEKSII